MNSLCLSFLVVILPEFHPPLSGKSSKFAVIYTHHHRPANDEKDKDKEEADNEEEDKEEDEEDKEEDSRQQAHLAGI